MRLSHESLKEQIELISTMRPAYKFLLDFLGKVRSAQFNVAAGFVPEDSEFLMDEVRIRQQAGHPLVGRADFSLDLSKARALFDMLCTIGAEHTEKMRDAIAGIREVFPADNPNWEELMMKHYDATYLDECAREKGIDRRVLAFVIKEAARPFIEARAEDLMALVDQERWLQASCPVCGSLPAMAEFREEGGKRYLHCGFCSSAWRWKRISCAYCTATDSELLGYFTSETEEAYRVDLCDSCHSYIKTVDTRVLAYRPDMVIEDAGTLHLDLLAREKGYMRPAVMSPLSG